MKRIKHLLAVPSWGKKFLMLCTSIFVTIVSFAQDKKVDIDINTDKGGGGGFFASPVVWVIGVAVFILLLVALMRSNSGSRTDA
jgi:hypothetical protein